MDTIDTLHTCRIVAGSLMGDSHDPPCGVDISESRPNRPLGEGALALKCFPLQYIYMSIHVQASRTVQLARPYFSHINSDIPRGR